MLFVSSSKYLCLTQGPEEISMLSSTNCIVLIFTFKHSIHLELIFVYGVRQEVKICLFFLFFQSNYPTDTTLYNIVSSKHTVNQIAVLCVWVSFLLLNFLLLLYLFILEPIIDIINELIISLYDWWYRSSSLVLFLTEYDGMALF